MSFLTERYFQVLDSHKLYNSINSVEALQTFLDHHVICVWSYQTLLQSIRRDLYYLNAPLISDLHKEAIRLISEIVLEEEVDDGLDGRIQSNLELYLEGMEALGCDTSQIFVFFDILADKFPVLEAYKLAKLPEACYRYARAVNYALKLPLHARTAVFFCEGEAFIPDLFLNQVERLGTYANTSKIIEYFERHIDGIKRPGFSAAGRLAEILCGTDPVFNNEAERASEYILGNRIELWNKIHKKVKRLMVPSIPMLPEECHLRLIT